MYITIINNISVSVWFLVGFMGDFVLDQFVFVGVVLFSDEEKVGRV